MLRFLLPCFGVLALCAPAGAQERPLREGADQLGAPAPREPSAAAGEPEESTPSPTPPPPEPAARSLPLRLSERPLTMTAGTARLEFANTIGAVRGRFGLGLPLFVSLALSDDSEVGIGYPLQFTDGPFDPTLRGVYRLFHESFVDVGFRLEANPPIVTNGDLRTEGALLALFRVPRWLRIDLGFSTDIVWARSVSPLLSWTVGLVLQLADTFALGGELHVVLEEGTRSGIYGTHYLVFDIPDAHDVPVADLRMAFSYGDRQPPPGVTAFGDITYFQAQFVVQFYPRFW